MIFQTVEFYPGPIPKSELKTHTKTHRYEISDHYEIGRKLLKEKQITLKRNRNENGIEFLIATLDARRYKGNNTSEV